MWKTVQWNFRTVEESEQAKAMAVAWKEKHKKHYQIREVLVCNAICYEYKRLKEI